MYDLNTPMLDTLAAELRIAMANVVVPDGEEFDNIVGYAMNDVFPELPSELERMSMVYTDDEIIDDNPAFQQFSVDFERNCRGMHACLEIAHNIKALNEHEPTACTAYGVAYRQMQAVTDACHEASQQLENDLNAGLEPDMAGSTADRQVRYMMAFCGPVEAFLVNLTEMVRAERVLLYGLRQEHMS